MMINGKKYEVVAVTVGGVFLTKVTGIRYNVDSKKSIPSTYFNNEYEIEFTVDRMGNLIKESEESLLQYNISLYNKGKFETHKL